MKRVPLQPFAYARSDGCLPDVQATHIAEYCLQGHGLRWHNVEENAEVNEDDPEDYHVVEVGAGETDRPGHRQKTMRLTTSKLQPSSSHNIILLLGNTQHGPDAKQYTSRI